MDHNGHLVRMFFRPIWCIEQTILAKKFLAISKVAQRAKVPWDVPKSEARLNPRKNPFGKDGFFYWIE